MTYNVLIMKRISEEGLVVIFVLAGQKIRFRKNKNARKIINQSKIDIIRGKVNDCE